MSNVFHPGAADRLTARIHTLTPDTPGQWGRMNAHQAIVHLIDSFRISFREQDVTVPPLGPLKYVVRFAAFTLPLPMPKGVKTAPELDKVKGSGGSEPGDFDDDRDELIRLLERYLATGGDLPEHPVWGRMSRGMAGRYAWRHMDHHLRQFGV